MDTRERARNDEQSIVLSDWIDELDNLGLDTGKVLQEEHAFLKQQQTIHAHFTRYRDDYSRGVSASASRLADAPDDYDMFASNLATAHYPETLDRIFVVGAPSFFPTIWQWAQRWFDPITVVRVPSVLPRTKS